MDKIIGKDIGNVIGNLFVKLVGGITTMSSMDRVIMDVLFFSLGVDFIVTSLTCSLRNGSSLSAELS
jgi:hypothetical protein